MEDEKLVEDKGSSRQFPCPPPSLPLRFFSSFLLFLNIFVYSPSYIVSSREILLELPW